MNKAHQELPEYCYTVFPTTGEFALLRRGERGYCPIDVSLAGSPDIRSLADKLNQQFGITKEQEAEMLAGAMQGWEPSKSVPQIHDTDQKD